MQPLTILQLLALLAVANGAPLIAKRLRGLSNTPYGLDSPKNWNLLEDLDATLVASKAVPGSMEAWIDALAQPGRTFAYTPTGRSRLPSNDICLLNSFRSRSFLPSHRGT